MSQTAEMVGTKRRKVFKSFTWYELLGMAIAIGAGVIGAVVTSSNERLQVLSVLLGGTLAITIAVVSQLDKVGNKVVDGINDSEQHVMKTLEQMTYAILPMSRQLNALPEVASEMELIASAAANAKTSRAEFIYSQIVRRIGEERVAITNICNGEFLCRSRIEEFELLDAALATANTSVNAVAALGLLHWVRPGWHEYFSRYISHAKEHPLVKHTRVFLLTPDEVTDPVMKKILLDHRNAGIETLAVDRAIVDEEFSKAVVIFDSKLVMNHVDRNLANGLVQVTFTDDAAALRGAVGAFTSLANLARECPIEQTA